jgi:hypothetical protein
MKKFLTIFLAALMVLSLVATMAIGVGAEDDDSEEKSVVFWNADTNWVNNKGKWALDTENQREGEACVSLNLKGVTGTWTPDVTFSDTDASNTDTLEFEIYLSDLGILDHLANNIADGELEIASSGTCDYQEKNIHLKDLVAFLKDNGAVVGWNHVAIPLEKMNDRNAPDNIDKPDKAGPFDPGKINWLRFYWVNLTDCGQDWVLKFDNFRLTNAQAYAEIAWEKFVEETKQTYADLIADLEALKDIYEGEINADNFASAQAKYQSLKAEYDALTEDEKKVLADYSQDLNKTKRALADYQEVQKIVANKADLIADLEALATYKEAAAFTNANYDEAKAAIEAARTAVDALTKSEKKALESYIAYLTAAEAAMPAEKPAAPVEDSKGGCKGALTIGAVATMMLAGAWVTIAARKKED